MARAELQRLHMRQLNIHPTGTKQTEIIRLAVTHTMKLVRPAIGTGICLKGMWKYQGAVSPPYGILESPKGYPLTDCAED